MSCVDNFFRFSGNFSEIMKHGQNVVLKTFVPVRNTESTFFLDMFFSILAEVYAERENGRAAKTTT